jgi:hypothetical protein
MSAAAENSGASCGECRGQPSRPSLSRAFSVPRRSSIFATPRTETVKVESSIQGREWASASRCPSRNSSQKRARALAARRSAGLFWDHRQKRNSASRRRFHMSVLHRRRRGRLCMLSFASRPPRRAGSRCRARGCLQKCRSCATLPRRLARQSARSCRRSACSWSRSSARDRPSACPEA